MNVLEMEEVEGLVGGNGNGNGNGNSNRKKLNHQHRNKNNVGGGVISLAMNKNFVTYIVVGASALLLLLFYVSMKDTAQEMNGSNGNGDVIYRPSPTTQTVPNGPDVPEPSTPISLDTPTAPDVPATTITTMSPTPAPQKSAPTTPTAVATAPTEPPVTMPNSKQDTSTSSYAHNLYSKFATFVPLVDPPLPQDEDTKALLADRWGKWGFWDGDEDTRPKTDYLSMYPNKDCPGDEFPDDAWQVDAVFVNHYLDDADHLITRAMDAIFAEYGHPREGLAPEQLVQRMQQFHWDKVNMSDDKASPPPKYRGRQGDRGNGGWTTQRSQEGLERRLLHAMMTSDTFTVVMGGHSAAAAEGNHFRQSYMMQFHKVMAPIFARLGVKLITRNVAMGGLGTIQHSMGSSSIYGDEIDLLIWDSGMTEGRNIKAVDMFLRQGLIGGKRVPVIWGSGINFDLLKNLHEQGDADIGEFGQATDLLPEVESEEQAQTIPWAARFMKCVEDAKAICKAEPRYCTQCWVDRDDGIEPPIKQLEHPKGQASWHPGWRPHQLVGRNLAMRVLQSLQNAINLWNEHVSAGPPLADDFWHITDYYENIRNKVMNMTEGPCYEWEEHIPTRMCRTPMRGMTHYTPRANPETTGINAYVKPTAEGYVPSNTRQNVFDGPDPPNPCFQVPDGEIDVYAIVSGRRRRLRLEEQRDGMESETTSSSNMPITSMTPTIWKNDTILHRNLEESMIVPGKGWELISEPSGYCDGTYNSICQREGGCVLQGHQAGRGAILGNAFSGWLVVTVPAVKEGLIVIKIHTWHYANENTITEGWTTVNNEPQQRLLRREPSVETPLDQQQQVQESYSEDSKVDSASESSSSSHRMLGVRSTETPEQPDTMVFDYAVDGKITSLPRDEFLEKKKKMDRVVEVLTLLDDPNYIQGESRDVEIAIRMRGCARDCNFALSHVYWA